MTPEEWRRARAVFDGAVEREDEERSAFLREACGDDAALRATVEALLRADAGGTGALERPAWDEIPAADPAAALVGARLGAYEIVSVVGQGGMGVVYRAVRVDDQFRREVAVKLVRGGMDSALVLERFRQEREILAGLDHPNIARLLDAGRTADGRPYLVMDYVPGEPIDAYCARRALDVRARLELFRRACAAVAYAHRHLVVHRDLKPANILIDSAGVPKLLDFGIAKLLAAAPGHESTATGLLLATPEYASPEQVRGERINTASDVYSLGVLLYELLTGVKPYEAGTRPLVELVRIVCQEEPVRPSAVPGLSAERRRALAGDLDNIVLLALRKEPERRYASVEQLDDDIRRHLDRRPVRARPDTFWYRTARLVRRNPLAGALLLLLVGWVGVATHQTVVARRERARAQKRFTDVRRLANTFLFEFHDAIASLPGATRARELAVQRALEYLAQLSAESEDDPTLRLELGLAYKRIGDIQYQVGNTSRGDSEAALASFAKAAALLTAIADGGAGDTRAAAALAELRFVEAGILRGRGDVAAALVRYAEAERLQRALSARDPSARPPRRALMDVHRQTARAHAQAGRLSEALARHAQAAEIALSLASGPGAEPADRLALGRALRDHAEALRQAGDLAGALDRLARAEPIMAERLAREPESPAAKKGVAVLAIRSGDLWMHAGEPERALRQFRRALQLDRELAAADPADGVARDDIASASTRICEALLQLGRPAEARPACQEALEIGLASWQANPTDEYAWGAALGHQWMGRYFLAVRDAGRARRHLVTGHDLVRALRARNPNADYDVALGDAHVALAELNAAEGRAPEAQASYREAIALYRSAGANDPADYEGRLRLAETLAAAAGAPAVALADACGSVREASALLDSLSARHPLPGPGVGLRARLAARLATCGGAGAESADRMSPSAAR
jgi:non-specific serine/threonine protein kinase/serine/threonine-protein kinase